MMYVAKFTWEPHRGAWLHHPSGAAVAHWDSPDDLDKMTEIARTDVAKRRQCEPSEVTVEFVASSFTAVRPVGFTALRA